VVMSLKVERGEPTGGGGAAEEGGAGAGAAPLEGGAGAGARLLAGGGGWTLEVGR
jgi:hypothetical protein